MNAIDVAVEVLERSWCTGELHEPFDDDGKRNDKYCAVGALAVATGSVVLLPPEVDNGEVVYYWNDGLTYDAVDKTEEIKALAAEIVGSAWWRNYPDSLYKTNMEKFVNGESSVRSYTYSEVVYVFNDAQESKDAVIELFKKAARRLDK